MKKDGLGRLSVLIIFYSHSYVETQSKNYGVSYFLLPLCRHE